MVMVLHQAISMAEPVVAEHDKAKDREKNASVILVPEYGIAGIAP
jgi:hypothetical protein